MIEKTIVKVFTCDNCSGHIAFSCDSEKVLEEMLGHENTAYHFCCDECMDEYILRVKGEHPLMKEGEE